MHALRVRAASSRHSTEMLQCKQQQQQEVSMGPGRACALHPRGGLMWKEHHLRTPIIDQRHQREKQEQQAPSSTVSPSDRAPPPAYRLTNPPHPANGRATSSSLAAGSRDEGGRDWKSGEMLFYYLGEVGKGRRKTGGGGINPLLSEVKTLNRLSHPTAERRRSPLPWGRSGPPHSRGRSFGG